MPDFVYRGRDGGGKPVNGVMEGANSGAVADALFANGVTPIEIRLGKGAAKKSNGNGSSNGKGAGGLQFFKPQITHVDVLLFSKQIHTLLRAGVPIMRTLAGLQESSNNPSMKELLQDVRESLDAGRDLSISMARHPKVFSAFYLSMVRIGEMTGRLEEVFIRMFDHLEFERFMREQVKSALRYPSFVIAAMAVAMFVVNIWVIPAFAKVFQGFNTELPLMTRILLGFSNFMLNYWHVMIGGVVAAFVGFGAWTRNPKGRLIWDRIKLRIPIAGKIIQKATLARFARSFALASRSGVPIIQALSNVSITVDNDFIASKIEGMRDGVERGESILRTAIAANIFTPVVLQMIAVGEESGSLDDMMQDVADMYQSEVEYELKALSQQIEPILITALGIMVLILALGIFLPIWDMGKVSMKK